MTDQDEGLGVAPETTAADRVDRLQRRAKLLYRIFWIPPVLLLSPWIFPVVARGVYELLGESYTADAVRDVIMYGILVVMFGSSLLVAVVGVSLILEARKQRLRHGCLWIAVTIGGLPIALLLAGLVRYVGGCTGEG